jgi:hypothetical protein
MQNPSKLAVLATVLSLMVMGAIGIEVFRVSAVQAGNARRNDLNEYMRQLNGSPRKLGVITGTATNDESNATTANTFSIPRGETLFIVCDVDAVCIQGTAAATSYTSASMGFPLTAGRPWPMIMRGGSSNIDTADALWCASASAWNCAVFSMD